MICARSAYLHTGQRPYQAALEGLIHDRTRSHGRAAQNLLARLGASIHDIRHLISRLQQLVSLTLEHVLAWSFWRRLHQAAAKICHWKRRRSGTPPDLQTQL